jgi:hypothetical protein
VFTGCRGLTVDSLCNSVMAVHAKRQSRGAVRMASGHRNPQPFEAPQPLDRQHRLTPTEDGASACSPPSPARTGRND